MTAPRYCECRWQKPLIAITRADGLLPTEALVVRAICPVCETAYTAGEIPQADVDDAEKRLAAAGVPTVVNAIERSDEDLATVLFAVAQAGCIDVVRAPLRTADAVTFIQALRMATRWPESRCMAAFHKLRALGLVQPERSTS